MIGHNVWWVNDDAEPQLRRRCFTINSFESFIVVYKRCPHDVRQRTVANAEAIQRRQEDANVIADSFAL